MIADVKANAIKEKYMKTTFRMVLTAVMLLGLTSVTIAQQKESDDKTAKPSRVSVDTVKLTGTVKAVDLDKKTATIEGSGGRGASAISRRRVANERVVRGKT